ncbi:MAG: hypothetical protein KF770_25385 [Anaerolineae bacterium]|nr:hypothetical protein [Anaerolineae bacterium]
MPNTAVTSYFLNTKLYRPTLPEDYIVRPQLLTRLDDILHRPLTLLTAPAGYGKTTLLSAWIDQATVPCAWVSLDEGDNDLVGFLGYFIAAVRSVFPDFGEQLLAFMQAAALPSLPVINLYLVNELDQLTEPFVLALDDYHMVTNPDIHQVLADLLHFPPEQCHLVLLTRHDPPLPLARLRAQRQVTEIRVNDLRFSHTEVAAFAALTLPTTPDKETISILADKTEGWAVGLRLAILAIRRWGIADQQPAILQVENRYVAEYLVNEVLARQPTAVRDFLLKTSILDRFCAPLCAAVMETPLSDLPAIERLEREGLFIESLDSQNQWYRYHQLFRQLLRHRLEEQLPAAEVAALHKRAGIWLAANGLVEDAIDHALTGGDVPAAINFLMAHSVTLLNKERWLLLESYLQKFSESTLRDDPRLLLLLAWLSLARWQLDRLETIRQQLAGYLETASLSPADSLFLQSSYHLFTAIKHNWAANSEEALFHLRAALAAAAPDWTMFNGFVWLHLGVAATHMAGEQDALAALAKAQMTGWLESVDSRARKQLAVCFIYVLSADLPNLRQAATYGIQLAESEKLFSTGSTLRLMAGSVCYQQNDLEAAAAHFTAVLDMRYVAHPVYWVMATINQAMVYLAQNQAEAAWQVVESAEQYCLEMEIASLLFTLKAFEAELALRQGDLEQAAHWAVLVDPTALSKTMPFIYQPQMTWPRILIAQNTTASHQRAEAELARLYEIVTSMHNIRYQIEVLAMQALLYQAQDNLRAAETALVQALRLAQPGGFIRLFVDLGPQTAVLLKRLAAQGIAPTYVRQILDAFPKSGNGVRPFLSPPLIESLTDREIDVLRLLARRLSNKEIADILYIAPETVKRHTINIYQKLAVGNRRQAVSKATELGLLMDVMRET